MAIMTKDETEKYLILKKCSNSIIESIDNKDYDNIEQSDQAILKQELKFLEKVENRIMLDLFSDDIDDHQWNLLLKRISKLQRYIDTFRRGRRF